MKTFTLSPDALKDIDDIWDYTCNEWSLEQANRYVNELYTTCERLSQNPFLEGKPYPFLPPTIRGYKVKRHIIFYHRIPTGIWVARVIHESRDLPTIFSNELH